MTTNRIETLDIFRGISILLVAFYHYTARLPATALNMDVAPDPRIFFGWMGVILFFVISGYCIYLTLERASTVRVFLARRFSRIYPAYLAAVIGLFILQFMVPIPSVPEAGYRAVTPGAFDVLLNLVFVGELGEWVNGSFWSIAVEIKFYALTALLAAFLGTGPRFVRLFFWLSMIMACIWLIAAALSPPDARISARTILQFLTIAPYLPFFALGILARQRQIGSMQTTPYLAATLLICLMVLAIFSDFSGGIIPPLTVVVIFSFLIWLFLRFIDGKHLPHVPVLSASVARMGFLSYSWYLLHETLGFAIMAATGPYLPGWWNVVFAAGVTFLIAWLFAIGVEWRFRKLFEMLALWVLDKAHDMLPFNRPKIAPEA